MSSKLLIVEDEVIVAMDIAAKLEKAGYEVSGFVSNAKDCLEKLKGYSIDLILLDINIEGDTDGIELAKLINGYYKVPFIFLTSYYDKNTIARAKETSPKAYLIKPFNVEELVANVEMALFKSAPTSNNSDPSPDKFFVRQDHQLLSLDQSDIYYAEAYDNYTYIHTATEKYLISHTLKSVEQKLSSANFVRVHRSYLINFHKITCVGEGFVYLDDYQITVGQSYKSDLFDRFKIL